MANRSWPVLVIMERTTRRTGLPLAGQLMTFQIPEIFELDETKVGFFALSDRARGDFLDELDGEQIKTVLPSLLRTMDAIHGIDISSTEGYGIWGSDSHGPQKTWREALLHKFEGDPPTHRTHGWRVALEASPGGTRDFDAALRALEQLAARMPAERHVIHNDLLNHNVLVQGDRISAVLDWGNSMYGDHLYDAAWLLYCQPRYTSWPELDLAGELRRHWEALVQFQMTLKSDCSVIRSTLGSMHSLMPHTGGTGIS